MATTNQTDLDDKLEKILCTCLASTSTEPNNHDVDCPYENYSVEIKELYTQEVLPKSDELLQDMVNLHANMQQNMYRLGLTPTPTKLVADFSNGELSKLMTGQEWYDRFADMLYDITDGFQEAPDGKNVVLCFPEQSILETAQKASGIE